MNDKKRLRFMDYVDIILFVILVLIAFNLSRENEGLRHLLSVSECQGLDGSKGVVTYKNDSLSQGVGIVTYPSEHLTLCQSLGGKHTDYVTSSQCIIYDPMETQVLSLKNYCSSTQGSIRISIENGVMTFIVCDWN